MPAKIRHKRYVVYTRVSSDRQDIDNSMSSQEAAANRFVETHGGTIIRTYRDGAKTGKVERRPASQQMIQDAADPDKPLDAILVWNRGRFARNRNVSITYKSMFAELGISVISTSENTGDGPGGRMVEGIIESIDEFHSANMDIDHQARNAELGGTGLLPCEVRPHRLQDHPGPRRREAPAEA